MRLNLAQNSSGSHAGAATVASAVWLAALLCFASCKDADNSSVGNGTGSRAGAGATGVAAGSGGAATSGSAAGSGGPAAGALAVPTQCKRAEGLDGPGAPRDSCLSKRALVRCMLPNDVTQTCLSDDPTRCPSDDGVATAAASSCTNQCEPNEYAVSCGGVGPNIGSASPPAGCRSMGRTPGGPAPSCCPCL